MIGVSKHLCGAATDLAMRCLATFSSSENAQSKIETILIALCCHHRCDWNIYVGKKNLKFAILFKSIGKLRTHIQWWMFENLQSPLFSRPGSAGRLLFFELRGRGGEEEEEVILAF